MESERLRHLHMMAAGQPTGKKRYTHKRKRQLSDRTMPAGKKGVESNVGVGGHTSPRQPRVGTMDDNMLSINMEMLIKVICAV